MPAPTIPLTAMAVRLSQPIARTGARWICHGRECSMRHNEGFRMSSDASAPPSTPLMRQYHGIKQQVPNTLLMFRLGDFYELFYEDAVTAARELEITLTARNKEKGRADSDVRGAVSFSRKLHRTADAEGLSGGHLRADGGSVGCDEIGAARGYADHHAGNDDECFVAALARKQLSGCGDAGGSAGGVCFRRCHYGRVSRDRDGAGRRFGGAGNVERARGAGARGIAAEVFLLEDGCGNCGSSARIMRRGVCAITSGCSRSTAAGWRGSRWRRARRRRCCTICGRRSGVRWIMCRRPRFYSRADALVLDATTVRNLELVEPLFAGESQESTLLSVLDRTRTGMGGSLLRRRLLAPSLEAGEIEARLDAVEELVRGHDPAQRAGERSGVDSGSGAAVVEDQSG